MKDILDEDLLNITPPKKTKWFYNLLILFISGFIISTIASWIGLLTILFSGPIMSVLGICLSFIAIKSKDYFSIALGLVPFLITIICFIIISHFDLSPSDCEPFLPIFLSIVSFFIFVLGVRIYLKK